MINVDFADVRTVMSEMGHAMMGSGIAKGEDRAEEAAEMAISSPLLEDIDLAGARGVLVNITAGLDMRLDEFETVGNTVKAFASDNATVVIGTSLDPDMADEIRVTVVATGIGNDKKPDITLVSGGKAKVAQPVVAAKVEEKPHRVCRRELRLLLSHPRQSRLPKTLAARIRRRSQRKRAATWIFAFLRRQAD